MNCNRGRGERPSRELDSDWLSQGWRVSVLPRKNNAKFEGEGKRSGRLDACVSVCGGGRGVT